MFTINLKYFITTEVHYYINVSTHHNRKCPYLASYCSFSHFIMLHLACAQHIILHNLAQMSRQKIFPYCHNSKCTRSSIAPFIQIVCKSLSQFKIRNYLILPQYWIKDREIPLNQIIHWKQYQILKLQNVLLSRLLAFFSMRSYVFIVPCTMTKHWKWSI